MLSDDDDICDVSTYGNIRCMDDSVDNEGAVEIGVVLGVDMLTHVSDVGKPIRNSQN